ncbi:MAG: hypothetical protein KAU20_05190 [Nanoarchaeota archaeon]|nr:hypothetical protein [Nanoarchaeota archaeon]
MADKKFIDFYKKNLEETKRKIKASVTDDLLIVQIINNIDDLNKIINILAKDLREWYSYYNPEFSKEIQDHARFVELILSGKDKKIKQSMGAELSKEDLKPIFNLAKKIKDVFEFRDEQEICLEKMMKKVMPNATAVAGSVIGARLLQHAGSLKRLIMLPSSTVQLLGAEKALFRHIKSGSKCPKYGVLHEHPLIMKANRKDHGKIARALADKISIAARVDYFKGKFIGDELIKGLEERFG